MTVDGEHHDVVVVGAGAAGVSCALECFDVKLDVLLLETGDAVGGQLPEIAHRARNVAFNPYADGRTLRHELERSVAILGDRLRLASPVSRAGLDERWVEVHGRRIAADAIVVATGSARQELPAAPDGACGGDVTYQVESDPDRFAGRDVVVIGGGDSATLEALELAQKGSSVTLVHRSETLTARRDIVRDVAAEPRITDLPGWELEAVRGTDRLDEVVLVRRTSGERRTVAAGGVVVKISRVPRTDVFRGQLELDAHGAVVVDGDLRTSRHGVFAAGDVVSGAYWRVATALGHGSLAARSVLRHLQGAS